MFIYKGKSNSRGRKDAIIGIPARDLTDTEAKNFVDALNLSKEQMEEIGSWKNALTRNGLYKYSKIKPKTTEA